LNIAKCLHAIEGVQTGDMILASQRLSLGLLLIACAPTGFCHVSLSAGTKLKDVVFR